MPCCDARSSKHCGAVCLGRALATPRLCYYHCWLTHAVGGPAPRHIQVEPRHVAISEQHVVAASSDVVYVWQHRSSFSKALATEAAGRRWGRCPTLAAAAVAACWAMHAIVT
jgi:hypothetical protein